MSQVNNTHRGPIPPCPDPTHFIFTDAHKRAFLSKLDGQFSEQAMRDYFCGFNETDEPDAGKWMFDGIQAFRQSLSTLDESSVIIFSIG